jgi:SET domain-containing protein
MGENPPFHSLQTPCRCPEDPARKSAIHGNGVFAVAPIKQGERVIQYKGLLRSRRRGCR